MDLTFNAKRFVRPALPTIALCISIIVISSMTIIKPVYASGDLITPPSLKYTSVRTTPACQSPNYFSDGAEACTCVANNLRGKIYAQWTSAGTECVVDINDNLYLV
jgi:hypothetical protein